MKFKKLIILLFLLIIFLQPVNASIVNVQGRDMGIPSGYTLVSSNSTNTVVSDDCGYHFNLNFTDNKPVTIQYYGIDCYNGANNTLVFVLPEKGNVFLQISYNSNEVHDTNVSKDVCYTFAKMLKD